MKADFSGYATKNGLKCSDGRTIMAGAFKHSDGMTVPLVWQHQHNAPGNILGHALLENRDDGVYTYGYFNDTPEGQSAKELVKHGDITALSIYANQLKQQGQSVFHGDIKEVSLVLSGANPGAFIDNVNIQHGDVVETIDDEVIIYTGLSLEHADNQEENMAEKTVKDVFDSFTDEQKNVVYYMIGEAISAESDSSLKQSALDPDAEITDEIVQEVFETFNEDQQTVVRHMLEEALTEVEEAALQHNDQEGKDMRNVFEQNAPVEERQTLSHDQLQEIVSDAQKSGSFKESFLAHVATYGIENIDILFPDAKATDGVPDVIGRRTEWVASVLGDSKHSPFSRIKSRAVDLTADEARAKGYVKGNMKKEEVIKLLKRVTTPTTIYKKQKLDRDDIVDITDLDVVSWLKTEMRVMLDEELAVAIMIGDGRDPEDEDKIDELCLRPIAFDDEMYAHQITVASDVSGDSIIESVLRARTFYKGTGTPTFYTTDAILTDLILLKDKVGRRLYETEASLAAALRVKRIVTVEPMEREPDLLGVVVNMADYTIGADKGGEIGMFDDFDIDYNQYKYLIETRASGALTKPKSAVVIKRTPGIAATPVSPSFDGATNTITIPTVTGVVYTINDLAVTGAIVITETTEVLAIPDTGYSFAHNISTNWTYIYTA